MNTIEPFAGERERKKNPPPEQRIIALTCQEVMEQSHLPVSSPAAPLRGNTLLFHYLQGFSVKRMWSAPPGFTHVFPPTRRSHSGCGRWPSADLTAPRGGSGGEKAQHLLGHEAFPAALAATFPPLWLVFTV